MSNSEKMAEDPSAKKDELTIVDPPAEFMEKMAAWEEDEGMFAEDAGSFKEYPLCLHFLKEVTPSEPSEKAREFLSKITAIIAGLEGYYGAGGGAVYVIYLGVQEEDALSGIGKGVDAISLLKLAEEAAEHTWAFHVDPTHQATFSRHQEDTKSSEKLLAVDELARDFCRELQWPVHPHVKTEYPYFDSKAPVLLFARILVNMVHDGDCPSDCPKDNSVFAAIVNDIPKGEEYADPGDITESPSFTLMQLDGTNEVIGLVNWDYLD